MSTDGMITRRAMDVLFIYGQHEQANEPCPSYRDVAKMAGGKSPCVTDKYLTQLDQEGCIRRPGRTEGRAARSVRLTDKGWDLLREEYPSNFPEPPHREILDIAAWTVRVPVLPARIAASAPLHQFGDFSARHAEEYRIIPRASIHDDENLFMLRVQGDSMINAGILSGDFVTIRRTEVADLRDIVAVSFGGEAATLKRFKVEGQNVLLCPENDSMAPIVVPAELVGQDGPDGVRILGRLVRVERDEDGVYGRR